MAIGMVLFWILIIIGIIALVRYTTGATATRVVSAPPGRGEYETPGQVLASRFARGEIDETEYRHRLGVLRSTDNDREFQRP